MQAIYVLLLFLTMQSRPLYAMVDSLISPKEQSMITIAAFTAKGDLDKLKREIEVGLQSGLTVNQIKEVQVHLYAYCGFPRSIRGLQTLMSVLDERKARGIFDAMGNDATPILDTGSKYERGRSTLSKLTNTSPDKPVSGYGAFAPVIDTLLKEHLYADLFDRDILTYAERELVTISVLCTIGNAEPMLKNHFIICLNLGFSPKKLFEFVELIKLLTGDENSMIAKKVLEEALKK